MSCCDELLRWACAASSHLAKRLMHTGPPNLLPTPNAGSPCCPHAGPVRLLTHPPAAGYSMNPISVCECRRVAMCTSADVL